MRGNGMRWTLLAACLTGIQTQLALGLEADWSSNFGLTGPDGKVNCALRWNDAWVIGGTFQAIDGQAIPHLAVLDEGQWAPLDAANPISGVVYALAELPDGRLAVGGSFTTVVGQPTTHLAFWDGQVWEPFAGLDTYDRVYGLAVDDEGALWVGGKFEAFEGQPACGLLRLVDGARDPAPGLPLENTGLLDPTVWDFAVDGQGRVLVSGWFDRVDGQSSAGVARWDGQGWSRLGATHAGGGSAYSVEVAGDDVYVGGWFQSWNALPMAGLARLRAGQWEYPGNPFAQGYTCLLADGDDLWAGNAWTADFAHFDGLQWDSVPVLDPGSGGVSGLAADGLGGVLAVGGFGALDGRPLLHAALRDGGAGWGPTHDAGAALGLFGAVYYSSAQVTRILPTEDGGALLFGNWQGAAGRTLGQPALWTGQDWGVAPFESESVIDAAIAVPGGFWVAEGSQVKRWDSALQQWQVAGATGDGPLGSVVEMALSADGRRLFVGGYFWLQREGLTAAVGLGAWNLETQTWEGVAGEGPAAGVDDMVSALAVDGLGRLVIGGGFSTVDGQPARAVARWDGETWDDLDGGLDGSVERLLLADDAIWAAGSFTVDGVPRALARHRAGVGWQAVTGPLPNQVRALLALPSGEVLVGGDFESVEGLPSGGLAAFDGMSWQDLGAGTVGTVAGGVQALGLSDGRLLVGGSFHRIGGHPASALSLVELSAGLAPVDDLRADVVGGVLRLSWSPVPGATDYEILHFESAWDPASPGQPVGTTSAPAFETPLAGDGRGFYRVTARASGD